MVCIKIELNCRCDFKVRRHYQQIRPTTNSFTILLPILQTFRTILLPLHSVTKDRPSVSEILKREFENRPF